MHKGHRAKGRKPRRAGIPVLLGRLPDGGDPSLFKRYFFVALVPMVLIAFGTSGYMIIEGERTNFVNALYMTVITLTTVGYGEYPELSREGRIFTMVLLLSGVFTLFWAAGEMIRTIVSGEVQGVLERRRMEKDLAALHGHIIVCGFGRMGRRVCNEFDAQGLSFVTLERNHNLLSGFDLAHGIAMHGDAASDDLLRRAGVERAKALVTVLGADADNLFITMSARLLNEKLLIVARCEEEETQQKLLRAGADRVVSPYSIGGSRVAQAVLRPSVVDFIDLATRSEHPELQMEETLIATKSPLDGASISNSLLHRKHGIFIVAIKRASGQMVYNPPGDTILQGGDTLIALGHREQLEQLEKLADG